MIPNALHKKSEPTYLEQLIILEPIFNYYYYYFPAYLPHKYGCIEYANHLKVKYLNGVILHNSMAYLK